MKKILPTVLLAVLASAIFWLNCGGDSNPLSPSSLAGTWDLVSFTNKQLNITANAGQPTDIGNGVTITVNGSLVLTETRYQISLTIVTSVPGQSPVTETESSAGTYSINGSTATVVEDGTGDTIIFTISRSGNRLTLEDAEERTVWEK